MPFFSLLLFFGKNATRPDAAASCVDAVQHADDAFQVLLRVKGDGNFAFSLLVARHLHFRAEHVAQPVAQFGIFLGQAFRRFVAQFVASAGQRLTVVELLHHYLHRGEKIQF